MRPHIIGIAGASGSGKTALAQALAKRLPQPVPVVDLDAYYRDLSHMPLAERIHVNFDSPEALDEALLVGQIQVLACGTSINKPIYDFTIHTRSSAVEPIMPGPFVIIEGLFSLYWPALRALCHTKIFLPTNSAICFDRRLQRDTRERGRTAESVQAQWQTTTLPMFEHYVWPTREYADLILETATDSPTQLAERIVDNMRKEGMRIP